MGAVDWFPLLCLVHEAKLNLIILTTAAFCHHFALSMRFSGQNFWRPTWWHCQEGSVLLQRLQGCCVRPVLGIVCLPLLRLPHANFSPSAACSVTPPDTIWSAVCLSELPAAMTAPHVSVIALLSWLLVTVWLEHVPVLCFSQLLVITFTLFELPTIREPL